MTEATMTTTMDRPLVQPWWRKKSWLSAITVAGAIAFAVAASAFLLGGAERSVRVAHATFTVSTVEHGVYHDFIPLRGKVVPRDTIYLDALEGGRVDRVLVEPGDYVTTDQPLIELSNTELELDVLDREARLIESLTQLQAYQTQLEQIRLGNEKALALIDYDIVRLSRSVQRRSTLVAQKLESQETRDTVQDELDYAKRLRPLQAQGNQQQEELRVQQLPQIRSQLEKLRKDVEITRSKLDSLTVRAPAEGRMTAIDLKVGESRNRGERLGEITPDTGNKLSAEIDEFYLGRLHKDQSATVEMDGRDWPLRVTRVHPQVKNGTFTVDLAFDSGMPDGLLPGQTVQGKLTLGGTKPGLILPAGAFLESTGGNWIFVLTEDGASAHRRDIEIGRRNAEQVEILSGLQAGERVLTSAYSGWESMDRVDLSSR
jgi:HlyD family secretion protein